MKILASISPIVFHTTGLETVAKILASDKFLLTPALFSGVEQQLMPKGKVFYLSTARNRNSDYLISNFKGAVLTLDGRKLGQRYSGSAIDYWGEEFRKYKKGSYEQEDRIYSKDAVIPKASSYIKEIALLDESDKNSYGKWFYTQMEKILTLAEAKGIQVYVYRTQKDLLTGNKLKARSVDEVKREYTDYLGREGKYEEREPYRHHLDSISGLVLLMETLQKAVATENTEVSELLKAEAPNKDVYDAAYRLLYSSSHDFTEGLGASIQNQKSNMTEEFSLILGRLTKLMRKLKATNLKELYDRRYEMQEVLRKVEQRNRVQKAYDKVLADTAALGYKVGRLDIPKEKYADRVSFVNIEIQGEINPKEFREFIQTTWSFVSNTLYDVKSILYLFKNESPEKDAQIKDLMVNTYKLDDYSDNKYVGKVYDMYDVLSTMATAKVKVLKVRK